MDNIFENILHGNTPEGSAAQESAFKPAGEGETQPMQESPVTQEMHAETPEKRSESDEAIAEDNTAEATETAAEAPETGAESDEEIAEVVVHADEEEQNVAAESAAAPANRRANSTPRDRYEGRRLRDNDGVLSEELYERNAREKTQEEIENDIFNELRRYERNGEILWGRVVNIGEGEDYKGAIFDVEWNNVIVRIPDIAYFEKDFDFGSSYEEAKESEKIARRVTVGSYQLGAEVCFKVKSVSRRRIEDGGAYAGENLIDVVGSRVEAMETRRDTWFFHKNRKESTPGRAREVNIGDIVEARILAVRVDRIMVECLGVESSIDRFNVPKRGVKNCNDFYRPGDKINVRVRRLHINEEEGRVYLSVSGRLNDSSKNIKKMRLNDRAIGTVDFYNRANHTYSISLLNGVQVSVRDSAVQGQIPLYPNDTVQVTIKDLRDSYAIGIARKL